jgi:hypothetical protein
MQAAIEKEWRRREEAKDEVGVDANKESESGVDLEIAVDPEIVGIRVLTVALPHGDEEDEEEPESGVDMFFDASGDEIDEGTGVEGTVRGERNEDVV